MEGAGCLLHLWTPQLVSEWLERQPTLSHLQSVLKVYLTEWGY